jgi:5-methylcytosine-specific restriction endonuclease McrA
LNLQKRRLDSDHLWMIYLMTKKKKTFNMNAVIRGAIRRTFARAPVKQEVLKAVRKEFPKYNKDGSRSKKDAVCYLCNVCKNYAGSTKVSVDHIVPVISVDEGFVDWNEFVKRLYCGPENLQCICENCHKIKTLEEARLRREMKNKKT